MVKQNTFVECLMALCATRRILYCVWLGVLGHVFAYVVAIMVEAATHELVSLYKDHPELKEVSA